ncbi:MAG: FAD-dependent oxidoreductase, partial [Deltaproteobacteria bacterium]|nr:FAD-dependent oxidoreductase [Deltaproteobacteria bacterium]
TLSPHLSESGRALHMELRTLTRVTGLEGEAGRFRVTLTTEPRYIDTDRCTACGECLKQFPECVRFSPGLDHRAPTCMRYPQATPYAYSIDMDRCEDVDALVRVCRDEAILPDDRARETEVEVSAVVLASGADLFDPGVVANWGYGVYPNVVTSLEYERILSASGPTQGRLVRPSDGKEPRKVAWIQCAGSRGINKGDVPYCSSACCMFALKEAVVTKERFQDDIEAVIFFMDMRTFGKDYELYYERAKRDFDVRFVRCRPHSIEPVGDSGDLSIAYVTDDGRTERAVFDMAVLSTGFRISPELEELAAILGIELNEHRFARTTSFDPVSTTREGIYVAGLIQSPKDIPETMVQASAAACLASDFQAASDRPEESDGEYPAETPEELPPERDVRDEEPRIGVFVCDCGYNIGGLIDVNGTAAYARGLPGVAVSEVVGRGCSRESLAHIQEVIRTLGLNRVVMGACSPRTHEVLFQDAVRKAGLNKYLVEIANLRDQDTWVHGNRPEEAGLKARDLIRMAVSSAALSRPLAEHTLPMNKDILVVGGGVTGMNTALRLAEKGYKVFLVERSAELGGVAGRIRKTLQGEDVEVYMRDLIARVQAHDRIQVLLNAVIVDHSGMPGMFRTGLQIGPRLAYRRIEHGAAVLATGAPPRRPKTYLLDEHEAVVTQLDLDGLLEDRAETVLGWQNVVMIQCVGSRCEDNPNCSRVCCQSAVKNALRILDANPRARVFVLYRDMRTYGFQEDAYREARERGVLFVHYEPEDAPAVEPAGGRVRVTFTDPVLGRKIRMEADCLALSTGFMADDEATEDLAAIFHLNRTVDGYFLEDHIKLRPVDLSAPGFFVAGTAHAPKSISECIAQAQAAAGRAQTLLAKDVINLGASVAKVQGEKCAACLICVRICPFDVPFINADGYSEIDPAKCHGCGLCAAECPAGAIQLMQYEDDQILAKVYGLLEGMFA